MSAQRKGKPGKKHSEEGRLKISAAHLRNSGRTEDQVREIRELINKPEFSGYGGRAKLSRFLNIPRTTLNRILDYKTWTTI